MYRSHLLRVGRRSIPYHAYLLTFVCAQRRNHFDSLEFNRVVVNQIYRQCEESGVCLIAYVLMPDHCHLLIQLDKTTELSDFVKKVKGNVAKEARPYLAGARLWQSGFHERCIRCEVDLVVAARYVVANPLRKKLVDKIGQFPYWNCIYL
ncbi:transposase [Pseudoalteromonas fenneropenaei]|uniref:Transposase n=1 Tax=Pseudoalteromonas fenneropenaei TaxID=1737459 RepID=A0ABV7CL03_9GAMM